MPELHILQGSFLPVFVLKSLPPRLGRIPHSMWTPEGRCLAYSKERKPYLHESSTKIFAPLEGFNRLFLEHISLIKKQLSLLALGVSIKNFLMLRMTPVFSKYEGTV